MSLHTVVLFRASHGISPLRTSSRQWWRKKTKKEDGTRVGSYMHERRVQRAAEAAAAAASNDEAPLRFLARAQQLVGNGMDERRAAEAKGGFF